MSALQEEHTLEERRIYREVKKQSQVMTDEQLRCRAGSHSFTVPVFAAKVRSGWEEEMSCNNGCEVIRWRMMDSFGVIIESRMRYPKGYLLKGTGRLTGFAKGAMRVENIRRVIESMAG